MARIKTGISVEEAAQKLYDRLESGKIHMGRDLENALKSLEIEAEQWEIGNMIELLLSDDRLKTDGIDLQPLEELKKGLPDLIKSDHGSLMVILRLKKEKA